MKFKGNEEEKKMEIQHFHWANIILIVFLFFSFLINLMIVLIHSKQKFLRNGFFIIIFIEIIMESLITISLLIMNIIYLSGITTDKWFAVFPIIFNFGYVTNILYNIRTMIYLMTLDKTKDESINYDIKNDNDIVIENDKETELSRQSTVGFIPHSFKSFHYCCFLLSIIHTILYSINLFNDRYDIENFEYWNWYYYFMNGSEGGYRLGFFVFHFIFFIVSIPYLVLSLNTEKISEHILLKRFSLYCAFSSLISLIFPISVILHIIFDEQNKIIFLVLMFAFIFYLLTTLIFRVNCYYIQYILERDGKGFCNRCISGFKILFCCQSIPSPNFIDLNSTFIYHSLANLNDFTQELSNDIDEKNEDMETMETKGE